MKPQPHDPIRARRVPTLGGLLIAAALFAFPGLAPAQGGDAARLSTATFAGGCFWCMEPPFDELEGVVSTTSGYTDGRTENPTYEQVSSGGTGHAEAVQVVYDPAKVSFERLVEVLATLGEEEAEAELAELVLFEVVTQAQHLIATLLSQVPDAFGGDGDAPAPDDERCDFSAMHRDPGAPAAQLAARLCGDGGRLPRAASRARQAFAAAPARTALAGGARRLRDGARAAPGVRARGGGDRGAARR